MELHDFERDELATLPWMADTMDVCDLDAGFNSFVQNASANANIAMLYLSKAAEFETLVPTALQGTDAWVLWLPHLDAPEIDALGRTSPLVVHSRKANSRQRDVRLAWQTPSWCFTVFEDSVLASMRNAYEDGHVTVVVANANRVAVRAVRIDEDFAVELAMGGSRQQLDANSLGAFDREGRFVVPLMPRTYRSKRLQPN